MGARVKIPHLRYPIVEVIWDDAAAHKPEWTDELNIEPQIVRSVGYLVYCKSGYVVIAQDMDESEHNGRTQIPRGMVKKMTVLRKKDK